MVDTYLAKYEGKELELFRNYGNPYETISIRVQIDEGWMYLGDEEVEHGPDGGRSIEIFTFDKDNTRKAFRLLSWTGTDPIEQLKSTLDGTSRTHRFIDLCKELGIEFTRKLYF